MVVLISKATKGIHDWVKENPPFGLKFLERQDPYEDAGFVVQSEARRSFWSFMTYPRFVANIGFWDPVTITVHDKTWLEVIMAWAGKAESFWGRSFEIITYEVRYGPDRKESFRPGARLP